MSWNVRLERGIALLQLSFYSTYINNPLGQEREEIVTRNEKKRNNDNMKFIIIAISCAYEQKFWKTLYLHV